MSVVSASSQQTPTLGSVEKCATNDHIQIAKAVGLRYVTDASPGIRRKRVGKHFSYIGVDEKPIHDPNQLQRIKKIGIPPAWTNVWICPTHIGHIQATGRDAKGRKQYRYHPRWRQVRDETKYDKLILFGETLPLIRKRVDQDLTLSGLPGHELFQYIDEKGELRTVESSDVNTYLRHTSEQDLTAKDFRTWGGTVVATNALEELGMIESET